MVLMTKDPRDIPFLERMKAEYLGVDVPDPAVQKREQDENLGIMMRIAAEYGEFTERELASWPIKL